MKFAGVGLEHSGRIALGVNGNGVEKDVFAHAIAKQFVNLGKFCSFKRAGFAALGVNEVDQDDLAFQHVVIKVDGLSVLGDEWHVGEIICAPVRVISRSRCYAHS